MFRRRLLAAILIPAALFLALGFSSVSASPGQDATGFHPQASLHADAPLAPSATDGLTTSLPVLDPLFVPRFEVEGTVRALVVQPDDKTVIAGSFQAVNGELHPSIARLNPDGTVDPTFALSVPFSLRDPEIYALALLPDGKLLVGGSFNFMDSTKVFHDDLVRLNPDGTLDESFFAGNYSGGGLDGAVHAILVQPDGQILIGGEFSQILGTPRNGIARLNPNGSLDATFDPGTGANGSVLALARQTDGKIVAGGAFTTMNGVGAMRIARLASNGTLDPSFAVSANGTVNTVAVQGDGRILLGGALRQVNGETRYSLARVQPDGTLDAPLATSNFYEVKSVLVLPDNSIVVGGWRSAVIFGGTPLYHDAHLALLDSAGNAMNSVLFDGKPTEVLALARRSDGNVIVGGIFRNLVIFSGEPVTYRHSMGLFSPSLQIVADFRPLVTQAGKVYKILPVTGGASVALGSFSLVNGTPQVGAAKITPAGALDTSFVPPFRRPSNSLTAGVVLPDGSLLLGGDFTDNYTDQDLTGLTLVHLDANGELLPFPAISIRRPTLAVDGAGRILVGGYATFGFPGITRLLTNGSQDATFNPGTGLIGSVEADGMPGRINAVLVQPDGQIVIAGKFASFNSTGQGTIVRLAADGSVDASFVPPTFVDLLPLAVQSEANALALQGDQLLVGGKFKVSATYRKVLRLQTNGSLDTAFTDPFLSSGEVQTLAILPDDSILAGGDMSSLAGGIVFIGICHLLPDGARHPEFTSGTAGTVWAIAAGTDRALVGGSFTAIHGQARLGMAGYELQEVIGTYVDPASGGTLDVPADGISYVFPAGAFTETVMIYHRPPTLLPSTGLLEHSRHVFDLSAIYASNGQPAQIAPGQSFTITIDPLDRGPLLPGTLGLWWWDQAGATWSQAGINGSVSPGEGRLTAQVTHLSVFAVLGETRRMYLPLVLKH